MKKIQITEQQILGLELLILRNCEMVLTRGWLISCGLMLHSCLTLSFCGTVWPKTNYCWPTIHICVHDVERMFGWHKVAHSPYQVHASRWWWPWTSSPCLPNDIWPCICQMIHMGINMRGKGLCHIEDIFCVRIFLGETFFGIFEVWLSFLDALFWCYLRWLWKVEGLVIHLLKWHGIRVSQIS